MPPPTPPPSWSLTSFFSTLAVFVSNCYCDTSPQAEWIKTTQTYCLTFLRTEVCNGCCRAKIKAWKGCVPFWRAQRRVCSSSQLLDAARFPWLVAPSIVKASTGQLGLSHSVSSLMYPPAFLFHLLRTLRVAWGPQRVQENLPISKEAG